MEVGYFSFDLNESKNKFEVIMLRKVLLILSILIQVPQLSTAQQLEIAKILDFDGDVTVQKSNGPFGDVEENQIIKSGDIIYTGEIGFAEVMFLDDSSSMFLTSNTQVLLNGKKNENQELPEIKKYTEGIEITIQLDHGDLFFNIVEDRLIPFDVVTSHSVISIKGYEFPIEFRVQIFEDDPNISQLLPDSLDTEIDTLETLIDGLSDFFIVDTNFTGAGDIDENITDTTLMFDFNTGSTSVFNLSEFELEIFHFGRQELKILDENSIAFISEMKFETDILGEEEKELIENFLVEIISQFEE